MNIFLAPPEYSEIPLDFGQMEKEKENNNFGHGCEIWTVENGVVDGGHGNFGTVHEIIGKRKQRIRNISETVISINYVPQQFEWTDISEFEGG
jgi:hypothetical protein